MALNAKVGSFYIDTTKTATQTQAITGVGFQPALVLLFWSGTTLTSPGAEGTHARWGWGAFVSSANRFNVSGNVQDAAATTASIRGQTNVRAVRVHSGTTTEAGGLDVQSMDSNGFTVIYDVVFTTANHRITYIALAGSDLTNIAIGTKAVPLVTGNYSVTGVGFQPDALLTFSASVNAAANHSTNLVWSMGMATDASHQCVVVAEDDDGVATSDTSGYGYWGELVAASSSAINTINIRESLVSMDSDGFTMNHLEGTASAYVYYYIALKGGRYSVDRLNTRTDGNDIVVTTGFMPKVVLFTSAVRAQSTQDTTTPNLKLSFGAATSATERETQGVWDEDNLADSETTVGYNDAAVYANLQDDAVQALMDIKSFDASGFTCVMDTIEPTAANQVFYMAIGETAAATPVSVFYRHLQMQGIG